MKDCPSCSGPTRRQWLAGVGGWVGLQGLLQRGAAQSASPDVTPRGTARTCIFINLEGGPSHLDTFDVKDAPWNPADARIEQLSGIALNTTFFPNLSRHASDLCILRSVESWEAAHERGQFYIQTAHPANPAFLAETPHIGAVVSLELEREGSLPPFLSLNGISRGATFLGGRFEPLTPPIQAGGLEIIEHNFFAEQSEARYNQRFALLQQLEASFRANPPDPSMASHAEFYDAADRMMFDPVISAAFQFSPEEQARYGGTGFGTACIVARNAVQSDAGASFISITSHGWDTHNSMFDRRFLPNMYTLTAEIDSGVSALVEDLKAAGKFDETLIVMMGEFGRTPGNLNDRAGRDHHKYAQSVVMMGGGIQGAQVVGATDAMGDRIVEPGWSRQRPIYMEDVTATMYSALGINWTKSITDTPSGRKFEYVQRGEEGFFTAVDEVFGG